MFSAKTGNIFANSLTLELKPTQIEKAYQESTEKKRVSQFITITILQALIVLSATIAHFEELIQLAQIQSQAVFVVFAVFACWVSHVRPHLSSIVVTSTIVIQVITQFEMMIIGQIECLSRGFILTYGVVLSIYPWVAVQSLPNWQSSVLVHLGLVIQLVLRLTTTSSELNYSIYITLAFFTFLYYFNELNHKMLQQESQLSKQRLQEQKDLLAKNRLYSTIVIRRSVKHDSLNFEKVKDPAHDTETLQELNRPIDRPIKSLSDKLRGGLSKILINLLSRRPFKGLEGRLLESLPVNPLKIKDISSVNTTNIVTNSKIDSEIINSVEEEVKNVTDIPNQRITPIVNTTKLIQEDSKPLIKSIQKTLVTSVSQSDAVLEGRDDFDDLIDEFDIVFQNDDCGEQLKASNNRELKQQICAIKINQDTNKDMVSLENQSKDYYFGDFLRQRLVSFDAHLHPTSHKRYSQQFLPKNERAFVNCSLHTPRFEGDRTETNSKRSTVSYQDLSVIEQAQEGCPALVISIFDISQRIQNNMLKELDKFKVNVLKNISHDVRQPLNSIILHIQSAELDEYTQNLTADWNIERVEVTLPKQIQEDSKIDFTFHEIDARDQRDSKTDTNVLLQINESSQKINIASSQINKGSSIIDTTSPQINQTNDIPPKADVVSTKTEDSYPKNSKNNQTWASNASIREATSRNRSHNLSLIKQNAVSMKCLFDNMIDQQSVLCGQLGINITHFKLASIISELSEIVYFQTERKGIKFSIKTNFDLNQLVLYSDQEKTTSFLNCILSNAIKFTQNGSISLVIQRLSRGGTRMVRFIIEDTGIGIAEDVIPTLFRLSQQNSKFSNTHGVGLGLAISTIQAQALGPQDKIRVKTQVNKGTKFWLQIYEKLDTGDNQKNVSSLNVNNAFEIVYYHVERDQKSSAKSPGRKRGKSFSPKTVGVMETTEANTSISKDAQANYQPLGSANNIRMGGGGQTMKRQQTELFRNLSVRDLGGTVQKDSQDASLLLSVDCTNSEELIPGFSSESLQKLSSSQERQKQRKEIRKRSIKLNQYAEDYIS